MTTTAMHAAGISNGFGSLPLMNAPCQLLLDLWWIGLAFKK
jgi:hypothetical protein